MATRSSPPDKGGKQRAGGSEGSAARVGASPHQPSPGRAGSARPLAPRRQYSDEYELYDDLSPGVDLIYGRNPVREALRGRRQVHAILVATGAAGDELEGVLRSWCLGVDGAMSPVDRVSPGELSARLGTPDHQGIAAVVDPYPYLDPDEILADHTLLVALDKVQDPHNLGAIIRTAEGAGAGVLIPRHQAAEVTGAVVKASAGATEHAAVARVQNLSDFLMGAKKAGFWIYGAAADADNTYTSQDYTYPTCFVLGSEGKGLGRRVASLCDVMVGVPLAGRVESLNVSVSAGILLYEAIRQRTTGR